MDFINPCFNFKELRKPLKANPNLIFHPIVMGTVRYLRSMMSGYLNKFMDDESKFALEQILSGCVEGMLPGATLMPPRKRRGGKLLPEEEQSRAGLFGEYKELLAALNENISAVKEECEIKPLSQSLYKEIVNSYQQVWTPGFSFKVSSTDEPCYPYTPPSQDIVQQWLDNSENKLGGEKFREFFAYNILGYHYNHSPGQIEGYIKRYRKECKKRGDAPDV